MTPLRVVVDPVDRAGRSWLAREFTAHEHSLLYGSIEAAAPEEAKFGGLANTGVIVHRNSGKGLPYAGEQTATVKGGDECAPAATDHGRVRVRADYGDAVDVGPIERQQPLRVLEENEAPPRGVEGHCAAARVVEGDLFLLLGTTEKARANERAQDAPDLVVDGRGIDPMCAEERPEALAIHVFARRHLQIATSGHGPHRIVHRAPVGHHKAAKPPLLFEHLL